MIFINLTSIKEFFLIIYK